MHKKTVVALNYLLASALSLSLVLSPVVVAQPTGIPSMGAASTAELSPNLERTLGAAIMEQGRRDSQYIADPFISQYLTELGQELAKASPVPLNYPIEVFALRDASINAFALPGGYVGINTGLISASDSESELASVVAHEVAHVAQRHVARGMTHSSSSSHIAIASLVGAVLAGLAGSADLAMGVMTFGQAAAIDSQLGFSRQAEQEADRLGYQMLRSTGYNPTGMVRMFQRLAQGARLNESKQSYAYTHPLSTQRLTDIENRVMSGPQGDSFKQSNDFWFVRTLAMLLQAQGGTAVQQVQQRLQSLAKNQNGAQQAAALYGLAHIAKDRKEYAKAKQYLVQAQQVGVGSALLDVLAVQLLQLEGQDQQAYHQAQQAWQRWPKSQAVALAYADTMQAQNQLDQSIRFLQQAIEKWPESARFYQKLAWALEQKQQSVAAREAMAQYYVLVGALSSAVSQLQQARELSDDFYQQSTLDVRVKELREQLEQDRMLLERFKS